MQQCSSISSCSLAFILKELGVLSDDCFLEAFVLYFLHYWKSYCYKVHRTENGSEQGHGLMHMQRVIEIPFYIFTKGRRVVSLLSVIEL